MLSETVRYGARRASDCNVLYTYSYSLHSRASFRRSYRSCFMGRVSPVIRHTAVYRVCAVSFVSRFLRDGAKVDFYTFLSHSFFVMHAQHGVIPWCVDSTDRETCAAPPPPLYTTAGVSVPPAARAPRACRVAEAVALAVLRCVCACK